MLRWQFLLFLVWPIRYSTPCVCAGSPLGNCYKADLSYLLQLQCLSSSTISNNSRHSSCMSRTHRDHASRKYMDSPRLVRPLFNAC